MIITSAFLILLVTVSSSDKLLTFAENSGEIGRRSLTSGKCLVDNPSNAGKPLCYINGAYVDTCGNKGCGGCCGSQCSWVGTYCNEADGVVAKCPSGYSQVGTLNENNDISGEGLGQSDQASIGKCKEVCESNPICVAFKYGGAITEGDSTLCKLYSSATPNANLGSNFRFCRKTVKCLQENPNNANKPLCFLNEVHKDTCSNKGCNGCCGSTCSWISNYCSESIVAECPSGYKHIGTLSENNNVEGSDLGQTQEESIEDCQALCESTEGCVAFMYGGAILKSAYSKHCKLSSIATSNNSWGSNFRFCQMLTEEPTQAPTVEPTQAPQTSSPSMSPIFGKCLVDNPSNVGKPLCYVDGEQVDTCSNKGCNGCCGSQCSWVGTYCNERDGVVAKCPSGYSQVGTLSENNDINGEGLGQSNQDSIGKCKELCESDPSCVAFMYGGANTEGDSTLCELSSSVTPNNSWGSNFRFCRKTVKCLEENPNNANKPLCFLNEVHEDTCSNKGCNGCCGSTCSWISNYCSESTVAECPIGYKQIGTLSENNDVGGSGMGQTQEESIEDCQALCESTEDCVAFMYGGASTVHDSKLCELSSTATPNNSWGSNFRFCQSLAFVKGPKTGCQSGYFQPTTAEECKNVAEANNVHYWGGAGHSSGADPVGCIYRTPDQDIYFNTHSTGSTNRNDRKTVCIKFPFEFALIDGAPNSLEDPAEVVNPDSTQQIGEVQCCKSDGTCSRRSPWDSNSNSDCISGNNNASKYSLLQALDMCGSLGSEWSLCSRDQVNNGNCKGKGCRHDGQLVWVKEDY